MYKTLISLETESGINLFNYNRELSFLRQLILDGHWVDAEEFIKPLKEHPHFEYNDSLFEIRKQNFFETVEQDVYINFNLDRKFKCRGTC